MWDMSDLTPMNPQRFTFHTDENQYEFLFVCLFLGNTLLCLAWFLFLRISNPLYIIIIISIIIIIIIIQKVTNHFLVYKNTFRTRTLKYGKYSPTKADYELLLKFIISLCFF